MAFKQNPQRKVVAEEIRKLVADGTTEEQIFGGNRYKLTSIDLPLDYPFYNLENVRTEDDCEEFISDKGLDADTFDEGNIFNHNSQKLYHEIIFHRYAMNEIDNLRKVFNEQGSDQRMPIYISADGVIINGNTRMSYWREDKPKFSPIRCLVFDQTVEWRELLFASNNMDSGIDFTQEMLWYQKAKQARRLKIIDIKNSGNNITDNEEVAIAKGCQYGSVNILKKALTKLELAEEYLNSGQPGITKFSDIRGDGKYQSQAFDTLQKGFDRALGYGSISTEIIEQCKSDSWIQILTGGKDAGFTSAHKAIESIWEKTSLFERQRSATDKGDDPMQPDDVTPPPMTPGTKETDEERRDRLEKMRMKQEAQKMKKNAQAFAKNLYNMARQLSSNTAHLINDKTDIPETKKALSVLEEEVKRLKEVLREK